MDKRQHFAQLFRTEYPGLVRETGLILGDRAPAEDVAADGFVEGWRRWDRVGALEHPGAWVRRVALRKAGRARWRRWLRTQLEASFESPLPSEIRNWCIEEGRFVYFFIRLRYHIDRISGAAPSVQISPQCGHPEAPVELAIGPFEPPRTPE
jgi:hypothetical protein